MRASHRADRRAGPLNACVDRSDAHHTASLDLPLGTVDASVIATAERPGTAEIATTDRRHFSVVQSTLGVLTLLP